MGSPASFAHGPSLIGTFFNVFLYGIMCTQCFLYYAKYQQDPGWIKLMVAILLAADTVNAVFDMWWIYDILINHFLDLSALRTGNWVFATDPAMVGIISAMVQLFFAWRVNVITRNMWVVALVVITALGSIFGGVGTAIAIHFVPQFHEFQKFQSIVIVWRVSAAVCDLTITIALLWHLRRYKTGIRYTDDILNRIMRLTVQNGLITNIWAIVDVTTYLASPTGLHLAFNFPLAKFYTNWLMSSLNSREQFGYKTSERTQDSKRDLTARRLDVVSISTTVRPEVFVHVETHEMVDVVDKVVDGEWPSDGSKPGASDKLKIQVQYSSEVV